MKRKGNFQFFPLLVFSLIACTALCPAIPAAVNLLQPGDLGYLGAFRLPHDNEGWNYGGTGLTYYPGGDPAGPADGYTGSLFGTGNDQRCEVAEISIPAPVISPQKSVSDLNTATTIQPFSRITHGVFTPADDGLPQRVDIAYLPAQGGQSSGKLYIAWGEHYQYEQVPSHAWSELTLSRPDVQGPWYLADYENFATNDYLFEIPEPWAQEHTPGLRLATGRFRDGSLGGSGPSLFAYGPWLDANPPSRNARLTHVTPLLLYGKGYEEEGRDRVMKGYTSADEWSGGAWLTSGDRSGIIFTGTKGRGNFWYGFSNGLVWPDNPPFPDFPPAPHNERGWWAESFEGVLYFYNPDDLAKVAAGTMAPYEPQPYAELNLDPYLWHIKEKWQKAHVGAVAFDRDRGILYIAEPFADGEQPIIHVFSVKPGVSGQRGTQLPTTSSSPASSGTTSTTASPKATTGMLTPDREQEPAAGAPGFGVPIAAAGLAFVAIMAKVRR
jgi:hypothetical protein